MSKLSAMREADEQTTPHLPKAPGSKCREGNAKAEDSPSSSSKPKPSIPLRSRSCPSQSSAQTRMNGKFRGQAHPAYRALNRERKEIRLLLVKPGAGDEPVSATFKHVFLSHNHKPRYETISYTWGDPTQRSTINLHGKSMSVSKSSERVVRRMRHPKWVRVLWIDAICVNQDDKRERGHQVGIMADIYGSTWRNLVWLGEDDDYTAAAVESIEELNEEFRRETDDLSKVRDTLFTFRGQYKQSSKQVLAKINPEALEHFYTLPWFSRLWVVQEAALAPQSNCLCGRYEITLERILRAASWLEYRSSGHGVPVASVFRCGLMSKYADHDYGLYARNSPLQLRMTDLLADLQDFSATDPRDHVFALLGLWQKHTTIERLPTSLEPDYMSPLSDVLRRATQFAIQEWGRLDRLVEVTHRVDECEISGLPTWVPRWHESFDVNVDSYHIVPFTEWPSSYLYTVLMDFEEEGSLSVNGAILDDVQQIPLPVKRWEPPAVTLRYCGEIESILSRHSLIDLASHGEILSEFARMGKIQLRDKQTNLYYDWISFLLEKGSWCRPGENCPQTVEFENIFVFQSGMLPVSHNRRFFITSSKYFGFGPQTMLEGDALAILDGLRVPAILRPSKTHPGDYEFVGQAAVYGIMKGEPIYKMRAEGRDYYRIKLR